MSFANPPSDRAGQNADTGAAFRPEDGDGPDGTYTVSELCNRVGRVLGDAFPDQIWVQGAISGLTRSNNGHVYFDLVDPDDTVGRSARAVLPVALFSSSRQLVNKIMRRSGGILERVARPAVRILPDPAGTGGAAGAGLEHGALHFVVRHVSLLSMVVLGKGHAPTGLGSTTPSISE